MKQRWILRILLAAITIGGIVVNTKGGYFASGMAGSLLVTGTFGYYIVDRREKRFNKWLREAVETEV